MQKYHGKSGTFTLGGTVIDPSTIGNSPNPYFYYDSHIKLRQIVNVEKSPISEKVTEEDIYYSLI